MVGVRRDRTVFSDDPVLLFVWADDGEDHVGSARLAYADEGIYRWLLQFVR